MQIIINNVSADYQVGPFRTTSVLQAVNTSIASGEMVAVIGHSGAGKTSLLKVMNGLLKHKEGSIQIGKNVFASEPKKNPSLLSRVGMVFQFPESQLFAETVEKDICFGPLNLGIPLKEAKRLAREAIEQVGLDVEILNKSPFSLSGGQIRKVAIAGILSMKPNVLLLDEPGAGLDPQAKVEIFTLIEKLNKDNGLTTIFVTHDMDDVARYANKVIVMENGTIVEQGTPRNIFANTELIDRLHLDVPEARRYQLKIEKQSGITLPNICLTVDELADALIVVGVI